MSEINTAPQLSSRLIYRDGSVRLFLIAVAAWGLIANLHSIFAGLLLVVPSLFDQLSDTLRPLLTFAKLESNKFDLTLFALAGNAIFAGLYYSIQRLCKAPLWSEVLAIIHFLTWQVLLVLMLALPVVGGGILPSPSAIVGRWFVELAIAIVWICFFGLNCAMTIAVRRERYLYVSLWFYIATIVAVGLLLTVHLAMYAKNSFPSGSLFAGAQDAWANNWYEQSLKAFMLIMPFTGLMYYLIPKAADRPLYSYKLTIVHFWSLLLLLICVSSNQLHYTTIPEWASTLGMLCGVMLWMPFWAGIVNGFCTLSGSWDRVKQDPALRFLVAGLVVFGIASLDRSALSIKSVHALLHYTDWELANSDLTTLGWVGLTTFGMIYWIMPRIVSCQLSSYANVHFGLAIAGLLLTVVPEYVSGAIQAMKWSQLSDLGKLQYSFMETLQSVTAIWWLRPIGGAVYALGTLGLAIQLLFLVKSKLISAETKLPPKLGPLDSHQEPTPVASRLQGKPVLDIATKLDRFSTMYWHRSLERQPFRMGMLILVALSALSALQWIAMILSKQFVTPIASIQPYTPLELVGRDLYVSQGCKNCHSQMVRPLVYEAQRYGAISQAAESIYDRPALWGEHRVGPDLAREGGGKQSSFWHWRHFENASNMTKETVMPVYRHLLASKLALGDVGQRIQTENRLGAPYDLSLSEDETIEVKFEKMAKQQAELIAAEIISQGGPVAYQGNLIKDTSAVALIAYIQRLGTDLNRPAPAASKDVKTN